MIKQKTIDRMNLEDFKKLGFIGSGVSYHPEGETYTKDIFIKSLNRDADISIQLTTTDVYCGYLWIKEKKHKGYGCSELYSSNINMDKLKKIISTGKYK